MRGCCEYRISVAVIQLTHGQMGSFVNKSVLAHSSASRRPARFLFNARYIVSVMYMYLYVSHVLSVSVRIYTYTYVRTRGKPRVPCIHIINTTCLCILAKVTRYWVVPPEFWWASDRGKTAWENKRHIFFYI